MNPGYEDLIAFHGHSCPGLAIGYRMSQAALAFLSGSRAKDEEIVAIVENDACGVDALQCLSGCTFGKGNLIFKDHGKQVYTLYNRSSRKGVRVVFNARSIPENILKDKDQFINWLLIAPEQDIITLQEVKIEDPEPARIISTQECQFCGEYVMETRTSVIQHKIACIPCANRLQAS